MTSFLRAALIAAALVFVAPLTAPAAHAEGASEHNQPRLSRHADRHHRDHDRDWRRHHDRHRDRHSDRWNRDNHRHGDRHHRNSAADRFWRLVH
ncbi:hypothetical protein [Inquilinus sp.]|uniref:hypothetical protein n=1 Tax=Inquilinus sp. TaxID=1932117 RepID=UPI00378382BC